MIPVQIARRWLCAAAGATFAAAALTSHAASSGNTLPVDPLGKQWWQLYAGIPNTVKDELGERRDGCAIGQRGDLWLLNTAGNGSTPVTRKCTIPRGTRIFLPVLTAMCVPFEGEGGDAAGGEVQLCRELIDPFDQLVFKIDGKDRLDLVERRAQSQPFPVYFAEDNIFDTPDEDVPSGIYIGVSEGYYALIEGLSPGHHVIKARALSTTNPDYPKFSFTWEIDMVAPKPVKLRVDARRRESALSLIR